MATKRKSEYTTDSPHETSKDAENTFAFDPMDINEDFDHEIERPRSDGSHNSADGMLTSPSLPSFTSQVHEVANDVGSSSTDMIMTDPPSDHACSVVETPTFTKPFKIWTFPAEILHQIFSDIFPVATVVRPWYACCMSTIGIRGFAMNDEGITMKPNVDVAVFRVNKACYEMGTNLLYGENHFHCAGRSDSILWFLMRIGDKNVAKIRKISFEMNTGWMADRRDPEVISTPFENSHEEDWAKSIILLQRAGALLEHLGVKILAWISTDDEPLYEEEDKEELNEWRKKVVDRLVKFRGIKRVEIEEVGSSWVGDSNVEALKLLIQQRPGL